MIHPVDRVRFSPFQSEAEALLKKPAKVEPVRGGFAGDANHRVVREGDRVLAYVHTVQGPQLRFVGSVDDYELVLLGQDPRAVMDAAFTRGTTKPSLAKQIQPTHWFILIASLAAAPRLLAFWWGDEFYSVGLLVAPWAFWVILRHKRAIAMEGAAKIAVFGLALGAIVGGWYLGYEPLSLYGVVLALAAHAMEYGRFRQSALPLALLAITVPPPGFNEILLESQRAVAVMSENLLALQGTPVVRDNFLLTAAKYSYSVEPLCTGLTGILATILLVGMTATHLKVNRYRFVGALAAGIGATILLNVERVVILVQVTETYGPTFIEGAFHEGVGLALSLGAFACTLPFLLPERGSSRLSKHS